MAIQPEARAAVAATAGLASEDGPGYFQHSPPHIYPSEPPVDTVLPPSIAAQLPPRDDASPTPLVKTIVPTLPFFRLFMAHVG
jgi:hypothetical protein